MTMEHNLFVDLLQSLQEAKEIRRGETMASNQFEVPLIDVKAVREQMGLSQSEFACLMRVSSRTVQNWEQHRRRPTGPAVELLKVLMIAPDVALNVLKLDVNRGRH